MAWRDREMTGFDALSTDPHEKTPLFSMGLFRLNRGFANFSSSDSRKIKGLPAQKLGFLFFRARKAVSAPKRLIWKHGTKSSMYSLF
jgi:hypothetical protein